MAKTELVRVRMTKAEKTMLLRLTTPKISMSDIIRTLIRQKFNQETD